MNHQLKNVELLYLDAVNLYKIVILEGADSIISDLDNAVEILKNNWYGMDAGIQIGNVVVIHNKLIGLRNVLSELAHSASKVASGYRHLQNLNGSNKGELDLLNVNSLPELPLYEDYRDMTYMTDMVLHGRELIDKSRMEMDDFAAQVNNAYTAIVENWTAGAGRNAAQAAFEDFINSTNDYIGILDLVSKNITDALNRYND